MYNVYPHSTAYGMIEAHRSIQRVSSRTRINHEAIWKETHTMHTPIHVLDAHVQAINTNRLHQARRAEALRLARGHQPTAMRRFITTFRKATGSTLISLGQWLQREHAAQAAREREATRARRTQTAAS